MKPAKRKPCSPANGRCRFGGKRTLIFSPSETPTSLSIQESGGKAVELYRVPGDENEICRVDVHAESGIVVFETLEFVDDEPKGNLYCYDGRKLLRIDLGGTDHLPTGFVIDPPGKRLALGLATDEDERDGEIRILSLPDCRELERHELEKEVGAHEMAWEDDRAVSYEDSEALKGRWKLDLETGKASPLS